ncbi:hypothetical protein AVEN_196296-1, partial [Araneus ventricosus]
MVSGMRQETLYDIFRHRELSYEQKIVEIGRVVEVGGLSEVK